MLMSHTNKYYKNIINILKQTASLFHFLNKYISTSKNFKVSAQLHCLLGSPKLKQKTNSKIFALSMMCIQMIFETDADENIYSKIY